MAELWTESCYAAALLLVLTLLVAPCDALDCSKTVGEECDLKLKTMTLTPPDSFTANLLVPIDFDVTLENNHKSRDITVNTAPAINFDCIMRYSESDIGAGSPPGTDPFATAPIQTFSKDCIAGDPSLSRDLYFGQTVTLSGICTMPVLTNAQCQKAKYLCLDCSVPGSATFKDKNPRNNRECIRTDRKYLTCDIDLELVAPGINNVCPATITAGASVTFNTPITLKNNSPSLPGNKLNDLKTKNLVAGEQLMKVVLIFAKSNTLPLATSDVISTHDVKEYNMNMNGGQSADRGLKHTFQLPGSSCPPATHICLKIERNSVNYKEDISTLPKKENNFKCCTITGKTCSPDPQAKALTVDATVRAKVGPAGDISIKVVLVNAGPGDILVAGATSANFKFEQFFSTGDWCTTRTLPTFPGTKCASTITGAPAKNHGLTLTAALAARTFAMKCSMTLTTAVCETMTHICANFVEGTGATYKDLDLNNNCACNTIKRAQCKPDVQAVSLAEDGGPVTLTDYTSPQSTWGFSFKIKNQGLASDNTASDILMAANNFGVKCFLADAGGTKIGGENFATVKVGDGLGLKGDGVTEVELKGDVQLPNLPPASCAAMAKVCCTVFPPNPPSNYVETIPVTNNKACTAANAVRKNCKPVFTGAPVITGTIIKVKENSPFDTLAYTFTYKDPTDNPGVSQTFTISEIGTASGGFFTPKVGDTEKLLVKKALDFETIAKKTYEINYKVADQGGPGASSTGSLTVQVIDVNEKPIITPTVSPDPTSISIAGAKGDNIGGGPNSLHIGVPERYDGPIYKFSFDDKDAGDVPGIATFKAPVLTAPASGTPTNPFVITKTGANEWTLSVKPGIIDNEYIPQYKVQIQACDDGKPQPSYDGTTDGQPLCSDPVEITLDTINIDEPPKWDPFPPVSIDEDVTAANPNVVTLNAKDQDNADLYFNMQCTPVTDIFDFIPKTPPASGNSLTIKQKANPGFDYETTKSYTCYVFAMDGHNVAVMGKLDININDKPENPKMTLPPGNKIVIPEMHCYGCHLYDFDCTDEDGGQTVTKSLKVYDTYFDRQAASKFQLDSLGRVLMNFDNNILYTKLNKYLTKFSCCDDTKPKPMCVSENVTFEVEMSNQAPYMNPNTTGITFKEDLGAGTKFKLEFRKKFHDPDAFGANPTCKIKKSRFSDWFDVVGNEMLLKKKVDYDTYTPPHHIYISVACEDNGNIKRKDAPDVPKLKTEMLVEVNILGVDDHPPVFAPVNYRTTIYEDAVSTQSVLTVTATDADIGVHGQMIYQLDPTDPNKKLANERFSIVRLINNKAEVRCRGGLDAEMYSSVIFRVNAVSPGPPAKLTGTATVTVDVRNVNDLRPRWVTPDYINDEISTTANIDTLVTKLVCKDDDILYNDVSYDQLSTKHGGFDYFKTDPYSGEVRSSYVQYEEDMRYFVRVVCKDSDPEVDISGIAIVRIDTYVNWKHVTNWTLCKPMADYNATQQAAFLSSVATLCPPCVPKIHNITEKDGKAVFHLYFIKDNTTYAKHAREYDKKFLETDEILERYYDQKQKGPKKSVKDNPVFGGCLVNITRFADAPLTNWFIDTIEGNMVLGLLMSLGFALLVTAVICAVRKACPGRTRFPHTPKGGRPPKPKTPKEKRAQTPKKQEKKPKTPKKEKRSTTPESVSDDEPIRQPTPERPAPSPNPVRTRKFEKFV